MNYYKNLGIELTSLMNTVEIITEREGWTSAVDVLMNRIMEVATILKTFAPEHLDERF